MSKYPAYEMVVAAARTYLASQAADFECSTNTLAAQLVGTIPPTLDVIYGALKACADYELADMNHKSEAVKNFRGNKFHPKIWHPSRGKAVARGVCPTCGQTIRAQRRVDTK